jgi:hypothetical protein
MASSASMTKIQEAYVAFYGRAADAAGQAYWAAEYEAKGWDAIVDAFGNSAEATALYGAGGDEAQIQAIYNQMFGRDGDAEGVAFYTNLLTSGAASASDIAARIFDGATGDDATILANKVAVADMYTASVAANSAVVYTDAEGARDFLSTVTASTVVANVDTDAAAANQAAAPVSGQTFTLTSGKDAVTGSAGDDAFNAALLTMNSGDTIDGGDGNDTLTAEINTDLGVLTEIDNVETVNMSSLGAHTIDLKNSSGITTFNNNDSTGALTLNNVGMANVAYGMSGSATNSTTVNFKAGTLSGASDTVTLNLNGASAAAFDVDAGFETLNLNVSADSSLTTLTVPGIAALNVDGSGKLTLNNSLSGYTSVDASGMTGAIVGKTINATTNLSTEGFTGSSDGTTILLGSGADNISFNDSTSASTKSNTIKMGAGNDTLSLAADATGNTYVFGEAGDDNFTITNNLTASDLVDGGTGTDTLTLNGTDVLVARSVENVVVDATSGASLTVNSSDIAQTITVKNDADANDDVTLATLKAGSTVQLVDATTDGTGSVDNLIVGFANTEASSTIDVDVAVVDGDTDGITVSKVSALTLDFAKAVDLGTADLTIDDTTSLTVNAAKSLDLTAISSAATDKLATVNITGSDAVTTGAILNSDALATLNVTAAKAVSVGAIAGAKALKDVSLTSTAANVSLGDIGGTTASTSIDSITVSTKTGTTTVGAVSAKAIGSVAITSENGAVGVGVIAASNGNNGSVGDVTITATKGDVTMAELESDKSMGTVTITSTAGDIQSSDGSADLITAKDSSGLTVNLSAKTWISDDAAESAATATNVTNTHDITASVAGAAAANINFKVVNGAASAGTVNLTATNTGGLTSEIINDGTAGDGKSSTINLGNAASGKTNAITMNGTVDNLTVNGGTGTDTVAFKASVDNFIKDYTIALGGGTDTVDFTNYDAVGDNKTAYDGLVINLGSSSVTFDTGTATEASVAAGEARGYDADAASTKTNTDALGAVITLSGVEKVIGTAKDDYVVANSTGSTITGGDGADIIYGGSSADTFAYAETTWAGMTDEGADDIYSFTAGTGGDVLLFDQTLFKAIDGGSDLEATFVTDAANTAWTTLADGGENAFFGVTAEISTTNAEVAASVAALIDGVVDSDMEVVFAVDDGVNTYLWLFDGDKNAGAADASTVEADELTLIATLYGVDDVTDLVSANFDFS